jgi:hypothetical protein
MNRTDAGVARSSSARAAHRSSGWADYCPILNKRSNRCLTGAQA